MNVIFNILGKIPGTNLSIPLWHILLLLFLTILLMLMGKFRFVVLSVFWFSFSWIFIKNEPTITKMLASQNTFTFIFVISGAVLLALSIWVFFIEGD